MLLLDIINLNNINFIENQELNIIFNNNYVDIYGNNIEDNFKNIFNQNILKNNIFKKKIKIIKILGEGSYGIVYKIKINSNYYALKINKNEFPDKLNERFNSLISCDFLKKYIINIYIAGQILNNTNNNDEYKYFSIMEYGGNTLKNIYNDLDTSKIKLIIKQLFNIIHITSKNKFLMTDLKLSNITITDDYKIKLIDIYMFCENYIPCTKCKIVRTYSTIEIEHEKRIYENPTYNFTCIYIPFAICIIDLLCKNSMQEYCKKICDKFNLDMNIKSIIPLLQIACYNFNNKNNNNIKEYKSIYKYKKKIENDFPIVKNDDLYDYFINLLSINHDFISKKKFILIINDLINLDPNQRSLKYLKDKLIN
jgi:serine/threonine protein kinase